MGSVRGIWLFMAAFAAFCGVGILLVRTDEKGVRWLGKLFPGARLLEYRWGRWLVAAGSFVVTALALAQFWGWLKQGAT